jgi:hypothetical protein
LVPHKEFPAHKELPGELASEWQRIPNFKD